MDLNLHYDYENKIQSEQERAELKKITTTIKILFSPSVPIVIEIGRRLEYVRNEILSHDEYGIWVQEELGNTGYVSADSEANYRNAYLLTEEYGLNKVKALTLSDIYMIARPTIPEEAKAEVIEKINRGERLTRKDIHSIIVTHLKRKE